MAFVLATDFGGRESAATRAASMARPLLEAGARAGATATLSGVVASTVRWGDAGAAGGGVANGGDDLYHDSQLLVALDGYTLEPARTAAELAGLFKGGGIGALERLDGSFVVAIVDAERRCAHVITDRAGSRPVFVARDQAGLLVGPELKCFGSLPAARGTLAPGALLSLLLNCYLLDEHTFWRGVRALGPARHVTLTDEKLDERRYWAPAFGAGGRIAPDEADARLVASVAAHLRRYRRPIIGLSGGVDSRVLVAAARRAGITAPTLTWSYVEDDGPESDFAVAGRIAQAAGVSNRRCRMRWESLTDEAEALVRAADGLVGHLGGFADRRRLAAELAPEHDALLLGDQCYRGESAVGSADEAVEAIGLTTLPTKVERFARYFLRADAADVAVDDYRRAVRGLVESAGPGLAPQDLHDRLYWQVRLPRLLTGPKALWRRYLEADSPMLAGPMLEVAAGLTPEQRVHKHYLREAVSRLAPDLAAISYAGESSRVKWRKIMRRPGPFQRKIVETLLDPQAEFDRWFDRKAIEIALRRAMVERAERPVTDSRGLIGSLRLRAGGWIAGAALRPPTILSLLTLKLWFAQNAGTAVTETVRG